MGKKRKRGRLQISNPRRNRLTVCLTDAELEGLERAVERTGTPLPHLVRARVLQEERSSNAGV